VSGRAPRAVSNESRTKQLCVCVIILSISSMDWFSCQLAHYS